MNGFILRPLTLCVLCALIFAVAGCGGSDSSSGESKGTVINGGGTTPGSSGAMTSEQLKEKAKKQKEAAMNEYHKQASKQSGAGQCVSFGISSNISTLGPTCTEAKALIVAGAKKWASLSTNPTRVHGFKCQQVARGPKTQTYVCRSVDGTVKFTRQSAVPQG